MRRTHKQSKPFTSKATDVTVKTKKGKAYLKGVTVFKTLLHFGHLNFLPKKKTHLLKCNSLLQLGQLTIITYQSQLHLINILKTSKPTFLE